MVSLVTLFWNICILRVGPESVPARAWFAAVLLIANIAVLLFDHSVLTDPSPESVQLTVWRALGLNVLYFAVVAAFTRAALHFRDLGERFVATFTAMLGTHLLIAVLIAIVVQLSNIAGMPPWILYGVLNIWGIVVWGFIYHRAFNTTLLVGIPLAFLITMLANLAALAVFTPPGT